MGSKESFKEFSILIMDFVRKYHHITKFIFLYQRIILLFGYLLIVCIITATIFFNLMIYLAILMVVLTLIVMSKSVTKIDMILIPLHLYILLLQDISPNDRQLIYSDELFVLNMANLLIENKTFDEIMLDPTISNAQPFQHILMQIVFFMFLSIPFFVQNSHFVVICFYIYCCMTLYATYLGRVFTNQVLGSYVKTKVLLRANL